MSEQKGRAPYTHPPKRPPLGTALGYSVDIAAEITGVGRDTVYAALRSGELEAVRWGARTIITAASLRRFFEALPRATFAKGEAAA